MAEGTEVFDAKIKAVDQATGPMTKVLGSMKGLGAMAKLIGEQSRGMAAVVKAAFGDVGKAAEHAGAAARKAGKEIQTVPQPNNWLALAGHVRLLRGHFGALNGEVGKLRGGLTSVIPVLGGLGGAGSLAGAFALVDKVSTRIAETAKTAGSVGLSGAQFGGLTFAAKMSDVPVESMTAGVGKLNVAIGNALRGKNKDVASLFKKLGISLKDAQGHALSAADAMPKLADAFARTRDPAMRAAMAQALFGKGGRDMIPLLMQGGAALQQFQQRANEVRYPFTGEEKHGLEEYHRSMLTLGEAVGGFTNAIGAKLAPVLKPIIDQFTNWIVANRDWIATGIAGAVTSLATSLSQIDVKQTVEGFGHLVGEITTLGGIVTPTQGIMTAFGAMMAGPIIGQIGSFVAAIRTVGKVLRAVGLLAMANPIGAAITVIAGTALLIYENWDKVEPYFRKLWEGVKAAFSAAWDFIGPIVEKVKEAANFAGGVVKSVGGAIKSVGGAISSGIASAAQYDEFGRPIPGTDAAGAGGAPSSAMPHPIPPVYGPGSSTPPPAPAPAQNGTVRHVVEFKNTPPGTTVQSSSSGSAKPDDVDVGFSQAGVAGAF